MAKLKFGSLATDARGSMGGITFTKNRYGAIARTKVSPTQPRTVAQTTRRNIFTQISQLWRNMQPSQRGAFSTWATTHPITDVFGDAKIMAGNAAFMAYNAMYFLFTGTMSVAPPPDPLVVPALPSAAAAVFSTGKITITTATQTTNTGYYVVWTPGAVSAGKVVVESLVRICGIVAATTGLTSFDTTPATYNPKLGFSVGSHVPVYVERYGKEGQFIDVVRYDVTAT